MRHEELHLYRVVSVFQFVVWHWPKDVYSRSHASGILVKRQLYFSMDRLTGKLTP